MKRLLLAQAGFLFVAALYWVLAPRSYRATSELFIHKLEASLVNAGTYISMEQVDTQRAGAVARSFEDPQFLSLVAREHSELAPTAEALVNHLSTATEFSTGRVELFFVASRPDLAERVLAAIIKDRMSADATARQTMLIRATSSGRTAIDKALDELDAANRELALRLDEEGWFPGRGDLFVQLQRGMVKVRLEKRTAEIKTALLDGKLGLLEDTRSKDDFAFNGFEGGASERDAVLSSLWISRSRLAGELANLASRYGSRYPLRDRTAVLMERVKSELVTRAGEQKADLANERSGWKEAIREFDERLSELKEEASSLRGGSFDERYSEIRTKRDGLQATLDAAKVNMLALETAGQTHLPRFIVFAYPHSSPVPTSPSLLAIVVVGQVCALTWVWMTSSRGRYAQPAQR